jgi:hypothetical protein
MRVPAAELKSRWTGVAWRLMVVSRTVPPAQWVAVLRCTESTRRGRAGVLGAPGVAVGLSVRDDAA